MFKKVSNTYDFIEMEKKWLEYWKKNSITQKYLNKNSKSKKYFSFIDGPITANNPMGVHHAWGRTYKDLWQRFFTLKGFKQRYQPGFDCQGLWIEVEVEKELGLKSKRDIEKLIPGSKKASIAKFVELCKQRVYKFSKIQTEQSKRLAYFMDWDNPYLTMSDENNYLIWHFLKKCYENGWIYKGNDSVPWCPRCETAISQHEMLTEDYKEVYHESVIFELPINRREKEYLLVWTTTPWTIPANIAVAVDKDMKYALVEGNSGDLFWVAEDAVKRVFKGNYKSIVKSVLGKDLVGLSYKAPFDNLPAVQKVSKANKEKFHIVFATDPNILPISTEDGTGLVHTAVSAGVEDFKMGKKLGLPMIPVIEDNANYLPEMGFLTGKNAKKNPRIILDFLIEQEKKGENWVFEIQNYKHRYPVCWRCKTELVWKVSDVWYIAMDKPSKTRNSKLPLREASEIRNKLQIQNSKSQTLRQRMITVAKKIKWLPEFGLDRELDWLNNMQDWLISKKNRYWGLALPIYDCEKCGHIEVIGSKDELKQRAIQGWKSFEGNTPHKPFIDEVTIKCKECGGEVKRIEDVGNPWLDAGIVPYSTISKNNDGIPLYLNNKEEWKKWFPADFITESFSGQFKNWFYSLIAMSTVLEKTNSFKTVLGFGTLLGEDGRPMHKSWGNAIEFNEGADKIGVDVMRWMYVRTNPSENLLFGYKKADEVRRKFYLILWNVYKYFVDYSLLENIKIPKNTDIASNNILDKWILSRFANTVKSVDEYLSEFNAKDSALYIESLLNDLSTWYIRRSRNRLWLNSNDNQDKLFFYETLHFILKNLSIILAPFLPFISDEMYTNLTGNESVHLESWPEIDNKLINENLEKDMLSVREVVEKAHSIRKEANIPLRQPLNLVTVTLKQAFKSNNSTDLEKIIEQELNIKKLNIKIGTALTVVFDINITPALKAEGEARNIIRKIQSERKKINANPTDYVDVHLPEWPIKYEDEIKKKALVKNIFKNKEFKIVKT
ncbi:MAG: isoleucine--tRNA ligase [bacterium]|nr:isoleucine--tRNA ligase [bacterium]